MKSYSVTIQMKPLATSSAVPSHGTIYLVGGESRDKMEWCDHSNETSFHLKQYFHMVLNLFST